jgi:hypothetical protein
MDMTTQAFGDGKPSPGDVSLCAQCGAVAMFDADMNLRHPTSDEHQRLANDPRIIHAQILIRGFPNKKLYGYNRKNSDSSDPDVPRG